MSEKKERIFQLVDVVSGEQKYAVDKFKLSISKDKKERGSSLYRVGSGIINPGGLRNTE